MKVRPWSLSGRDGAGIQCIGVIGCAEAAQPIEAPVVAALARGTLFGVGLANATGDWGPFRLLGCGSDPVGLQVEGSAWLALVSPGWCHAMSL